MLSEPIFSSEYPGPQAMKWWKELFICNLQHLPIWLSLALFNSSKTTSSFQSFRVHIHEPLVH